MTLRRQVNRKAAAVKTISSARLKVPLAGLFVLVAVLLGLSWALAEQAGVTVSAEAPGPPPTLTIMVTAGSPPSTGTVSDTGVNFGMLTPHIPVTASHVLTITTNAVGGYFVTGEEDHAMTSGLDVIPDVSGDTGTATHAIADAWALADTYGFGYTLAGTDAAFTSDYKQFADVSTGDPAQSIMSNSGPVTGSLVEVIYKINVDTNQPAGIYGNTITYLATGNF